MIMWTPGEREWVSRLRDSLENRGQSTLVLAPRGSAAEAALRELFVELLKIDEVSPYLDDQKDARMGPEAAVARAVGALVNSPADLREIAPERPCVLLLVNAEPDGEFEDWLHRWDLYLGRFKGDLEAGLGLRVVMLAAPGYRCKQYSGRGYNHIQVLTWPETTDEELLGLARSVLRDTTASLEPREQEFVAAHCVDLSGGAKTDLVEVLQQVQDQFRKVGTLSRLQWELPSQRLAHAQGVVRQFRPSWLRSVSRIFWNGGFLPDADEFEQTAPGLLDHLWNEGLWVEAAPGRHWPALTPAAMAALAEKLDPRAGAQVGLQMVKDRVSSAILARCIMLERLLKHRLGLVTQQEHHAEHLTRILDGVERDGLTMRQLILDSLTSDEPIPKSDLDIACAASLRPFLLIMQRLCGIEGLNGAQRRVLSIRNRLAHGHTITWESYVQFFDDESVVAFLGTELLEPNKVMQHTT